MSKIAEPVTGQRKLQEELSQMEKAKLDPSQFEPIYDSYFLPVFRFCLSRMANRENAAEVTSTVFTKALQNINKFNSQGVPVGAWLFRIARNEVAQHFRQLQKERVLFVERQEVEHLFEAENDAADPQEKELLIETMLQGLNELPKEDLELIELRFFENRSFHEIGLILKINEGHARVKTYRTLKKLKKTLNR